MALGRFRDASLQVAKAYRLVLLKPVKGQTRADRGLARGKPTASTSPAGETTSAAISKKSKNRYVTSGEDLWP